MHSVVKVATVVFIFVSSVLPSGADVRVSNLFGDHMVLQRDKPVPVWGTADPGEEVTVTLWDASAKATADGAGRWMAKLPAMPVCKDARDLVIAGRNTLTLRNVLVGDVWLCSGQSNMEWGLGGSDAAEDIAQADLPMLRRIKFPHRAMAKPDTDVPGRWEVCTPQSAHAFTAVGFYFARRIQRETGVPIGLLDDNWGGTRIEPWIPPCGFAMVPALTNTLDEIQRRKQDYREEVARVLPAFETWVAGTKAALAAAGEDLPGQPPMPHNPMTDAGFPTTLYNGMIHPVVPYAIRGALWYQGESNGGEGDEYFHKMQALIGGWRQVWGQGDFPFYFVQLADWQNPNENPAGGDGWARIRMAQLKSLTIPRTGMAVIIDVGDAGDIHPRNKFDVGERLALWALRDEYGKTLAAVSGPLYRSMSVENGKIRLVFDSVGSGLMVGRKEGRRPAEGVKDGTLKRFAIAGEDRQWVWADAVIDGETVVVSSPAVQAPVAVRYAYSMNPKGANLYNREGLPASPFRTDEW